MSELVAFYSAACSRPLPVPARVAYLFCLLGLTLTAAFAPMISASDLGWALLHIE